MDDTEAAPERRVRLVLHYDGAAFAGWQVQPVDRTVQGELEAALARLTGRNAAITAAGRTDRGVHATGQVASVVVPQKWSAPSLRKALNAVLPEDLWIAAAEEVPLEFHARYHAVARGYVYRVGTTRSAESPFLRRWCWSMRDSLAPHALHGAAARFLGTHSFRAFAKAGQPERGELCTVHQCGWRAWPDRGMELRVVANRFLHHMVRYMVGTMVDVARGRRAADDIDALLAGASDTETSPPAPARGLFLARVFYHEHELEAEEPLDEVLP